MSKQERLEKFWNKFKNASREEKKEMLLEVKKTVNKKYSQFTTHGFKRGQY